MNLLEKFIEDNKLKFDVSGSALNGACVIISGYALFLRIKNFATVAEAIVAKFPSEKGNFEDELERVFNFAKTRNYGEWWKSSDAQKIYKF